MDAFWWVVTRNREREREGEGEIDVWSRDGRRAVLFARCSTNGGEGTPTLRSGWETRAKKEFHYPAKAASIEFSWLVSRERDGERGRTSTFHHASFLPSFFLRPSPTVARTQPTARDTSFPLSASFSRSMRLLALPTRQDIALAASDKRELADATETR